MIADVISQTQQVHDVAWFMAHYGWNIAWTAIICAALIGR